MTDFVYTDRHVDLSEFNGGRSEFIDQIYYNSQSKNLAVGLVDQSGHETFYVYDNVPQNVFRTFVFAPSLGRFYNLAVKPTYGPAVVETNFLSTKQAAEPEATLSESVSPEEYLQEKAPTFEYVISWEGPSGNEESVIITAHNDHEAEEKFTIAADILHPNDYTILSICREL